MLGRLSHEVGWKYKVLSTLSLCTCMYVRVCCTRLESHACQVTSGGCVLSSRDSMTAGANSLSEQTSALDSHHSF